VTPAIRLEAKLALLIAINARSHSSAVRALADALRQEGGIGDPYATAQKLLRAAKARHPAIAWALASDAGVRLMRKDSELAERVMLETVRAIGVAPLAVHDSFIVPASQKGRLMSAIGNKRWRNGDREPSQASGFELAKIDLRRSMRRL
jgi:hypothetical protein